MPTTQPFLSPGDEITLGGVVVSIIGIVVTIVLFQRSRRERVKIRWVDKSFADNIPGGNRLLVFDVTCEGVPIYDLEVCLYIDARVVRRADGEPALVQAEVNHDLPPHLEGTKPLNLQAGQSMKFDLSLREFTKVKEHNRRKAVKDALMQVDYLSASVRVYCDSRRRIVGEVRSRELKAKLDWFFSMRHIDPSIGLPADFDPDAYDASPFDESE